jgi:hypothetical protein
MVELRARLALAGERSAELRRLQYDAVTALIAAQRRFVALHGEIVAVLRSNRELYRRLRLESLELTLQCDALRELVRMIERSIANVESSESCQRVPGYD